MKEIMGFKNKTSIQENAIRITQETLQAITTPAKWIIFQKILCLTCEQE